jgi:hypothetical protein
MARLLGGIRGVQHVDTAIERFIRLENVKRYRRLLKTVSDETERAVIFELLAKEQQKQKDCGDLIEND